MQAQLTTEERIAKMTLDEAYEWIRKSHSIYHTNDQPLIDAAKAIVAGHEAKVLNKAMLRAEAAQPDEEAAWNALPFYMKWWYTIVGSVLDFATAPVFWKVKRWHVAALLTILAIAFFGGRGVSAFLKSRAIAVANQQATEVVNPAALLNAAPQADLNQPDPSILLSQPIQSVVDCTAATCPDAQPYVANYQGKSGPAGSASLRSLDGKTVLGEIPKGTIVWVITSTIEQGKYCENGECRRGKIKPIAGLSFSYNGGWVSFTALQPVNP